MKKICQRCGQPFDGGRYTSMCKSCRNGSKRRVKVVDVFDVEWIQIPVAPKYEIDERGRVRNIRTGQIQRQQKQPNGARIYNLYIGAKQKTFTVSYLLWLVHGKIPRKKSTVAIPVFVSKNNERLHFDSCRQAAIFIARREKYSPSSVIRRLSKHHAEIYGWRINYLSR